MLSPSINSERQDIKLTQQYIVLMAGARQDIYFVP